MVESYDPAISRKKSSPQISYPFRAADIRLVYSFRQPSDKGQQDAHITKTRRLDKKNALYVRSSSPPFQYWAKYIDAK
jgi:hypothetical protein